jgi:hypothetical protein
MRIIFKVFGGGIDCRITIIRQRRESAMQRNKTLIRAIVMTAAIFFAATATSALAMNEDLVGAVVKTDQGAALSTDSGEYLVLGKNLSDMTGETVAVTGNVEDGVISKTIRAQSVKVLDKNDIIDPSASPTATHNR